MRSGWHKMRFVLLAAGLLADVSVRAAETSRPGTTRASSPTSKLSDADEALVRKLLRGTIGQDKAPAMERVLEGMHASRVKLSVQFDPGNETQKIQRQVVRDLDEAIAEAWRSQRPSPTTAKRQTRERRRRRRTEPSAATQQDSSQAQSNRPKPDERATRGKPVAAASRPQGAMRELRRGWGRLPERDRDEVVQGFGQDFLRKYREWIERYYRALANPTSE